MFSWEIMDLLLVIRMKTVSANKNKASCWGNLNRYLVMLLYTMWYVQMKLPDGMRQTCIDPSKINDTSCSESQQQAEMLIMHSFTVIEYS